MADPTLTYPEAIVIGLLQGVTELFPVSSLGHSVLLPAIIGGRWARDLSLSADQSPYLAFVVAVHVATAVALIWFFRADWVRIVRGLATSVRDRTISTPDQRLGWLLVVATVPVGLAGLVLEHTVRTTLGKPVPAALFLILNGLILAGVERIRGRSPVAEPVPVPLSAGSDHLYVSAAARRGGVSAAHVDLDDLAYAERERIALEHPRLTVDATIEPVRVVGDADALQRVLRNVVDNAARHAAGTVTLTVRAVDGFAEVRVGNDGPPIPAADRERIFDRFVRLDDSRSRTGGGTGLGLPIARDIVTAHDGKLTVDDLDTGALLRISLPGPDANE
jgi:hypothetical protein